MIADAPSLIPILVDRRVGSADLFTPLQRRRIPVELVTLEYADFAIVTASPAGDPILVGVERKRIRDMVQSLHSGRLAGHQLPGLIAHYTHRWIVVEGVWRCGDDGQIEVPIGKGRWDSIRMDAVGLERYLLTLELKGGCGIRHTRSAEDTATFLDALHGWWTKKAWGRHRSHLTLHKPPDVALFTKPGLVARLAAELPGVGFERAAAVARKFRTPLDMLIAGEDEWRTVPGIGKTLARRITQALQQPGG